MERLNTVLPNGTFGMAVSSINTNFSLIVSAINGLEYSSTKSKGIRDYGFIPSTETLPNAANGDWCMVLSEGNTFPATIWTFDGTTWSQGGTWNPEGIDLSSYAKTTEMTAAIAASIAQAIAQIGYAEVTVSGTTLSASLQNYVLPTSGGTIHLKMSAPGTGASTLNINNTGAKELWYNGAAVSDGNTWEANEIISVFYDGTRYMASNSQGGGKADSQLDENSTLPVQNKVVTQAINNLSENQKDVAYPELKDTNFLANTTTLSFWVYGSGGNIVWGAYTSNYPYYNRVLEIKTYTKYRITAREQPTIIALLQDNEPAAGKVASDWNNGNPVTIPAGGVYEVDSDKYPYLSARFGGSYHYPEKVEEFISIKEVLNDIHEDIEELHNVEENVQGDYSVLGVGKACRSGDIVRTSDGKLLKMLKSIDVLTLTKVLAVGDLRYYGGSTYKVLKAVDNYDSTATYNAGDYALGVAGGTTISVYDGESWSDATIAGMIADASLLESVDEEYIINFAAKPYNTSDVIFENTSTSKELFDLSEQGVSVSNLNYITPVKTEKGGKFTVKAANTGVWRSAQFSIPTLVPNKKYMICCDYKSTLDTSFIVSLDVIYRDQGATQKELTPKVNIYYSRIISCSGEYTTDSNGRVAIRKGSGRIKIDASNLPSNVTFLCFRFEQKTVNSYLEISNISILDYENMKDVFDTFEYHETPEYLTQQEYLFQTHRMNKILDAYAGTHFTSLCLLHCTDAHGDKDNLRRIMNFANQNPHIADVIHTGDIVQSASTNPAYIDESGAEKMLQVIGNHDHNGSNVYRYSQAEKFAKYLKHIDEWDVNYTQDVCYYYKDYTEFALRLIVIDCMEYEANNNNHWETVQRQWFTNVLDDARQNNKRVIVATHCPIGDMTWLYNGFNELCTDSTTLFGGIQGTTPKQALTDMANDVQTFINNGGTFLTWLTGHIHYSRLGWLKDYPDQFQICAPTAGAYAPNGTSSSYEAIRHYGLINRDEFNIIGLRNDTYRNAFYLLIARFGRTYNSHMQLADTLIVDLTNKEILK